VLKPPLEDIDEIFEVCPPLIVSTSSFPFFLYGKITWTIYQELFDDDNDDF
jgi:hypothetical protein